jgi:hypothetical protein
VVLAEAQRRLIGGAATKRQHAKDVGAFGLITDVEGDVAVWRA